MARVSKHGPGTCIERPLVDQIMVIVVLLQGRGWYLQGPIFRIHQEPTMTKLQEVIIWTQYIKCRIMKGEDWNVYDGVPDKDNQTPRDSLTGEVGKYYLHNHTVTLGSSTSIKQQLLQWAAPLVDYKPLYRGGSPGSLTLASLGCQLLLLSSLWLRLEQMLL